MRICLGHWGRLLKRIVGLFPPRHSVLLSGPGVSMCPLIPASWRLLIELSSLFTPRERRSAVHEVKILSRDQTSKKDKVNTSQLTLEGDEVVQGLQVPKMYS